MTITASPAARVHAGGDRDLVAEIARQSDKAVARVGARLASSTIGAASREPSSTKIASAGPSSPSSSTSSRRSSSGSTASSLKIGMTSE